MPPQTGSLLLNAVSPSQVTIQVPQALSGFNTVLNASSLTTSPVAAGAGCMYIAFASSVPVDAFLSTYDDFVSLVTDKCASRSPCARSRATLWLELSLRSFPSVAVTCTPRFNVCGHLVTWRGLYNP